MRYFDCIVVITENDASRRPVIQVSGSKAGPHLGMFYDRLFQLFLFVQFFVFL